MFLVCVCGDSMIRGELVKGRPHSSFSVMIPATKLLSAFLPYSFTNASWYALTARNCSQNSSWVRDPESSKMYMLATGFKSAHSLVARTVFMLEASMTEERTGYSVIIIVK